MNWADLIAKTAEKSGASKAETRRVLSAFVEAARDALVAGEKVPLSDLGSLSLSWRNGRSYRSISDMRKMMIDGRHVVRYRVGGALRDAVAARTPQYWKDPRHQSAWRFSETLISDLVLYHGARAPSSLPEGDAEAEAALAAAFGEPWHQSRRNYEARVPEDVRAQADHLLRSARTRWGA